MYVLVYLMICVISIANVGTVSNVPQMTTYIFNAAAYSHSGVNLHSNVAII